MKAEITHDGTLSLTPENHTESFALDCWLEKAQRADIGMPIVGHRFQETPRPMPPGSRSLLPRDEEV